MNPVALYESGQSNLKDDEAREIEYILDDSVDITFGIEDPNTSLDASNLSSMDMDHSAFRSTETEALSDASQGNDDENTQLSFEKRLLKKPRGSANQVNSNSLLLEIAKMRTAATEKKLELGAKRLELDEKRSDRDYEIRKMDAETRKMEAETRKMEAENVRMQLMQNVSKS